MTEGKDGHSKNNRKREERCDFSTICAVHTCCYLECFFVRFNLLLLYVFEADVIFRIANNRIFFALFFDGSIFLGYYTEVCAVCKVFHLNCFAVLIHASLFLQGGNDHEIFEDPRTIGHTVKDPEDTVRQLSDIFPS